MGLVGSVLIETASFFGMILLCGPGIDRGLGANDDGVLIGSMACVSMAAKNSSAN